MKENDMETDKKIVGAKRRDTKKETVGERKNDRVRDTD